MVLWLWLLACSWVLSKAEVEEHLGWWHGAMLVCLVATTVVLRLTVRSLGIEFGGPDISCGFHLVSCAVYLVLAPLTLATDPALVGKTFSLQAGLLLAPLWLLVVTNVRGSGPALLALAMCLVSDPSTVYHSRNYQDAFGNYFVIIALLISTRVRYVYDQQNMCLLGAIITAGFGQIAIPAMAAIVMLFMYGAVLFHRRRRKLPAALLSCRFVRLGYLRQMRKKGQRIQRLQDLPEEAFGDPEKARVILITSHRWLDRFTCDVVTDARPEGVRLASMLDRAKQSFPESLACCSGESVWGQIEKLLSGVCFGGSDVLLFFDFMGLPQIGRHGCKWHADPQNSRRGGPVLLCAAPHGCSVHNVSGLGHSRSFS